MPHVRHSRIIPATLLSLTLAAGLFTLTVVNSQTRTPSQSSNGSAKQSFAAIPSGAYAIDPAHSSINFSIRHMMINNVRGRFNDFAGTILYDDSDITKSSVEFTVKVASINTDVAPRDEHLRKADFFDAAKHPEMTFKSKRIERRGRDSYVAIGDFTLRGVTKEIALPFKLFGAIKDNRGARIGVEAATTINRQDYGVSWSRTMDGGGLTVANEVTVELMLEAVMRESAKPGATPSNTR